MRELGVLRRLPSTLVNRIAAGEVVERPASAVKELVENALDAGARRIAVTLKEGGRTFISVVDDGVGMTADELVLAVERHCTSKLPDDDLDDIRTLGFRGEALPSIASVSRFSLVTRTREADAATEVRIDGGGEASVREVGAAPGTTVTVRELFFNVPARKKFAKSAATETAHVAEVCLRAALADAGLRVVMTSNGRRAREHLPAASLSKRALATFGVEEKLSEVQGSRDGLSVLAMLGAPERGRSGAKDLHLYVNGRPVRDRALARAVAFAYGSVLPPGRYPVGVVWVTIDPERVDVNVHPQKAEVRFADSRVVLDGITRVIASGLGHAPFRGPVTRGADYWQSRLGGLTTTTAAAPEPDAWGLSDAPPSSSGPVPSPHPSPSPSSAPSPSPSTGPSPYASPRPYSAGASLPSGAADADVLVASGVFGALRVLGQAKRTYVVCEGDDGLVILDQHAADERVRFHRLRTAFEARAVAVQRLLLPERVAVSEREAAFVDEHADELSRLGLEARSLGETTVAVHGVPALVRRASPERLLRDVLAELTREGSRAFGDAMDTALATMACHGAIRAGDALSERECAELVRSLDEVRDFSRHCPHGRPVVMELGFSELARRVGR